MQYLCLFIASTLIVVAQTVLKPKERPCSEGDGFYSLGCSSDYIQCLLNLEIKLSCPRDLVFDHLLSECASKSDTHRCKYDYSKGNIVKVKAISINCHELLDGPHPYDPKICSQKYFHCSEGISYKRLCPDGFVYSSDLKYCIHHTNCTSSPVKSAAAAHHTSNIQAEKGIVGAEVSSKPEERPCPEGDGFYSLGCSQDYIHCILNKEFKLSCPRGLVFDHLTSSCKEEYDTHRCIYDDSKGNSAKVISINCYALPDGPHPFDPKVCTQDYFQCSKGIPYKRICTDDSVYSSDLKYCVHHTNCTFSPVKTAAAATLYAPTFEEETSVASTKEIKNGERGINCENLGVSLITKDGECSQNFYHCKNGKLFAKKCPEDRIYVLEQNLCEKPDKVKGCPEYERSEATEYD